VDQVASARRVATEGTEDQVLLPPQAFSIADAVQVMAATAATAAMVVQVGKVVPVGMVAFSFYWPYPKISRQLHVNSK
jgi:hypothetical protein